MTETPTPEALAALCAYWQKVLRLQDWDVTIERTRNFRFDDQWTHADCARVANMKEAVIRMGYVEDYHPDCCKPADPEQWLVHELLHLHFHHFMEKEAGIKQVEQERTIDTLAWALVKLNRGERPQ